MRLPFRLMSLALFVSGCNAGHVEPTLRVEPTMEAHPTPQAQPTDPLLEFNNPTAEVQPASLLTSDWAVQLAPEVEPNALALEYHAENLGQVGSLPNIYLFRRSCPILNEEGQDLLANDVRVLWLEEQIPHQQSLRSTDPQDQASAGSTCSQ